MVSSDKPQLPDSPDFDKFGVSCADGSKVAAIPVSQELCFLTSWKDLWVLKKSAPFWAF